MTARQHICRGPRHRDGACGCPDSSSMVPAKERNPISGYQLKLTCPACGKQMTHATARTDHRGGAANAVVECVCGCQARIDIVLTVTRHPVPPAPPKKNLTGLLPLEPWLEFFPHVDAACKAAAWPLQTLRRRRANGITEEQAEALAALVDRHPATIWPDLYGVSA